MKPLQGSLFRKCREVVMGREHIDSLKEQPLSPSQEHVGNEILVKIMPGDNVTMAGKKENVETPEPQDSYGCVVRRGRVKKNR